MKKTFRDTPVDSTPARTAGDERATAQQPTRRTAIKTLAATTALAAAASSMPLATW